MTAIAQPMPKSSSSASGWLGMLVVWHVLLALGGAYGLYALINDQAPLPGWVRWFAIGAMLLITWAASSQ